ncbi:hypothetical protein [Lysinibacillus xylanilyticus]|uniref:hypothetical protein n=1 Tax=Lysinibacillus xylanilyticus TaxID=582475 RepID=UPI0037FADDFF
MSHIHSHKKKFFDKYLFNRYETIKTQILPKVERERKYDFSNVLLLSNICESDKLLEIMELMFDINRVEIENPYLFHTSVPSARGLQSNEIFLNIFIDQQKYTFFYIKSKQDFVFIQKEKVVEKKNRVEIELLYNHFSIGLYYGRFGFILSLLDLGHQLNHIEHTLSLYDIDDYTIEYLPKQDVRNININNLKLVKIELYSNLDINFKKEIKFEKIKNNELQIFEYNDNYDEIFNRFIIETMSDDVIINRKDGKEIKIDNYREILKNRTSLQSYEGLHLMENEEGINIDLFLKENIKYTDRNEIVLLTIDINNKQLFLNQNKLVDAYEKINIENIFYDSKDYFDLDGINYVFLTLVKENYSSKTDLVNFIKSAEIMNKVTLFFSANEYMTRCFRNIDDKYVLSIFSDYDYVSYMQVAGNGGIKKYHL